MVEFNFFYFILSKSMLILENLILSLTFLEIRNLEKQQIYNTESPNKRARV